MTWLRIAVVLSTLWTSSALAAQAGAATPGNLPISPADPVVPPFAKFIEAHGGVEGEALWKPEVMRDPVNFQIVLNYVKRFAIPEFLTSVQPNNYGVGVALDLLMSTKQDEAVEAMAPFATCVDPIMRGDVLRGLRDIDSEKSISHLREALLEYERRLPSNLGPGDEDAVDILSETFRLVASCLDEKSQRLLREVAARVHARFHNVVVDAQLDVHMTEAAALQKAGKTGLEILNARQPTSFAEAVGKRMDELAKESHERRERWMWAAGIAILAAGLGAWLLFRKRTVRTRG